MIMVVLLAWLACSRLGREAGAVALPAMISLSSKASPTKKECAHDCALALWL
jgi:hypothetical protein